MHSLWSLVFLPLLLSAGWGWAGLGWAALGCAALLGWAALGWWAGLVGWWARLVGWLAGLVGWAGGLGWVGLAGCRQLAGLITSLRGRLPLTFVPRPWDLDASTRTGSVNKNGVGGTTC